MVAYVGHTYTKGTSGSQTVTLSLPTLARSGDTLALILTTRGPTTITTAPSGWTLTGSVGLLTPAATTWHPDWSTSSAENPGGWCWTNTYGASTSVTINVGDSRWMMSLWAVRNAGTATFSASYDTSNTALAGIANGADGVKCEQRLWRGNDDPPTVSALNDGDSRQLIDLPTSALTSITGNSSAVGVSLLKPTGANTDFLNQSVYCAVRFAGTPAPDIITNRVRRGLGMIRG